ncbi:uncharacterized protein K460DRAFT_24789 [Cucurbitaria berberidis CBS 394.84]|uniref:Uncharacterized protein n=1 Tax=Cucurbitaria berberidis CBS 394.84 TaxID=1168544 RepID=A0A9P4LE18_9PLEO|nr:uncharacterized protein K460DRAFT_24789 [Cucurbitaria berberidis CBS 394.84]KAF1850957.1 hypothetical protein K460DRAFT_24789 [Cucurbitaria berberidis CBS 394.84]
MFDQLPWPHDPFRRLHSKHSPFPSYHNYSAPNIDPYMHRSRRYPRGETPHRAPLFGHQAIEGSEFSDEDRSDHRYYLDDKSPPDHRQSYPSPSELELQPNVKTAFRSMQVKIPQRSVDALGLRKDDVLILAPTLTRLKVQIRSHRATETLRVAVAKDMRFRDVVKQLLPAAHSGEVHVHVKLRGEWKELDPSAKIGEVSEMGRFAMNERKEVEVKMVVGGGRGAKRDDMGFGVTLRGAKGWEREIGMESFWIC